MEAIILGNSYDAQQGTTSPIVVPSVESGQAIILNSDSNPLSVITSSTSNNYWTLVTDTVVSAASIDYSIVVGNTTLLSNEKLRVVGTTNLDTLKFGSETTYITSIKDEVGLVSNDIHAVPTQASVKAYVDNVVVSGGLQPGDNISELVNNIGYITTETDPLFTASPAYTIDNTKISNWDSSAVTSHSHTNKALLDTYTQTNTALSTAVTDSHIHTNLSSLENIISSGTGTLVLSDLGTYIEVVQESDFTNFADVAAITTANITNWSTAYTESHIHTNKALLDTYTQTDTDISTAIISTHQHSNKAILDTIISNGTGSSFLSDDGTYKIVDSVYGNNKEIQYNNNGDLYSDTRLTFDSATGILNTPNILVTDNIYVDSTSTKMYVDINGNLVFGDVVSGEVTLATLAASSVTSWSTYLTGINYAGIVGVNTPTTFTNTFTVNGSIGATDFDSSLYRYKNGNILIGSNAGDNEINSNILYIHNNNSATPLLYGDFVARSLIINGDLTLPTSRTLNLNTAHTVTIRGTGGMGDLLFKDENTNSGNEVSLSSLIDGTYNAKISSFVDFSAVTTISAADIASWGKAAILIDNGDGLSYLANDGTYIPIPFTPYNDSVLKFDQTSNFYRFYTDKTEAGGVSSTGKFYQGTTVPTATNRVNYDGYFYATKVYSNGIDVESVINTKEDILGVPTVDGYILSSTISGTRSWIAQGSETKSSIESKLLTGNLLTTSKEVVGAINEIFNSDSNKIDEAPNDSKTYGRNNLAWVEVTGGTGASVTTAITNPDALVNLETSANATQAVINAAINNKITTGSSQTILLSTSYSGTIKLDNVIGRDYGIVDITSTSAITADLTNAANNGNALVGLRGDGTNTPDLTTWEQYDANGLTYDSTLNILNITNFWKQFDKLFWLISAQYEYTAPDLVAMTLSAMGFDPITQTTATWNFTPDKGVQVNWCVKLSSAAAPTTEAEILAGTGALSYGSKTVTAVAQSQLLSNLTYSTTNIVYYFTVNASGTKSAILSTISFNTIARAQLATPTNVVATGISQTQIHITWDNVSGNNGYFIYASDTETGTYTGIGSTITDATQITESGLTIGQTRWYKIKAAGDQVTTVSSLQSTAVSGTTSSILQLSAPTIGTATVNTDVAITIGVSAVDANATYLKAEYKLTSSGTWLTASATLPRTTTSYQFTGLTANSGYDFRYTAIGDGVSYSNSNPSSTVSATTMLAAATLVSIATSTDGLTVTETYSRAMSTPSTSGVTFSPSKTLVSRVLDTDTTKVITTVSVAFASTDTITVTLPALNAASGMPYVGGSGISVTNNVVAGSSTAAIESIADGVFLAVTEVNADFTLTGSLADTIKSRIGTNKFTYTGTKREFDSANKKLKGAYSSAEENSYILDSAINFSTGDLTIVLYENTDTTIQQDITQGTSGTANVIRHYLNSYVVLYANSHNNNYLATLTDTVRKHVIKRTSGVWSVVLNGTTLTASPSNIVAGDAFEIYRLGQAGNDNRKSDFYALYCATRALDSTETNTVLSTLNTVLGV